MDHRPRHVLLLATLVTALIALLSWAVVRLIPAWQPAYLPLACLLVAVEAALVQYRMREGRHIAVGALRYLAAELFTLVVLMRATASLSLGGAQLQADLARWLRSPLSALDNPFWACLLAGVCAAGLVRAGQHTIAALSPPAATPLPTENTSIDAAFFSRSLEGQQRAALAQLGRWLLGGGMIALAALSAAVLNLREITGTPLPLPLPMGLAGITYLSAALLLYSRARLNMLRTRWRLDEAEVEPAVLDRWRLISRLTVLALALALLFLPRSYGMSLLDGVRAGAVQLANLLGLSAGALGVIVLGLFSLLLALPAWLLSLLGTGDAGPALAPTAPPLLPTPAPAPQPIGPPSIAPALIFWACVAILALYALWAVLRRQTWAIRLAQQLRDRWLPRLWDRLHALWGGARDYARKVGEAIGERFQRPEPAPPARRIGLHLSRLDPRGLVRYCYAALLIRAERAGLGRSPSQTPHEYRARLREQLPDADADIDQITDAYTQAAYAPRPISRDEARRAKGVWARLRSRLRGRP